MAGWDFASATLHRSINPPLRTAVRGEGSYIYDQAGKAYLDASGGAAVSCLGHSHPKVVQAVIDQVSALSFAHTSFFTNTPLEALSERLASDAPMENARALVVCDGSEAVEAALKLARQFHLENGQPERQVVIARQQSYHGNTLGALSVGGNAGRRAPYQPLLGVETIHIAPCYPYRRQLPGESLEAYGLRAANALEEAILAAGPERVMAFIAEPVVGATAGCLVPAPGYFRRIRDICTQYGVLLIADEIMCGMGRVGSLHASTAEGISPDLMTVAKGLGAGYQPIGAVIAAGHVVGAIAQGSGSLANGHTYMGHAVACAAALAVQNVLRDEMLVERVAALGPRLGERLAELFGDYSFVGDIRGRGFFWAIELVADRETKEPFAADLRLNARIRDAAMAEGLICYPSGGTVDGKRGDHVLLAPPFNMSEVEMDEMIEKLDRAMKASVLKPASAA
jgi:adenosylmethionine-8-amino-7-oxononanoate aminotransferase